MNLRALALCLTLAVSLVACDDGETDDGGLASGAQLFTTKCETCHGADGTGTELGPDMTTYLGENDVDVFKAYVKSGGETMPSFESLTDGDLDDLVAFIRTL